MTGGSETEGVRGMGRLFAGVAAGGALRWAAVDLTAVVEEARWRLDLGPAATVALGRCASAAAMLLRMTSKRPNRLQVDARGEGPLRRVMAEAEAGGGIRGWIGNRLASLNDGGEVGSEARGQIHIGPLLGKGLLRIRQEDQQGRAYESQVELVSGEIATDIAHYLRQSEQRRAAVLMGVLLDPGGVRSAGGVMVEALPGVDNEIVSDLEGRIGELDSVSRWLEAEGTRLAVEQLLAGLDPREVESGPLVYRCRCRRERLLAHLEVLTDQEIAELTDATGTLLAECAFCGREFLFRADEVSSRRPS